MSSMNGCRCVVILAVLFASSAAGAMPGAAHDQLATLILETPASNGGAAGLDLTQVESIHRWIDNPATKTGQYTNRVIGKPVHPTNHGHLRHNPIRTTRALSGTGGIDQAKLNVARLHKIGDVAENVAGVDGWQPTARMKREAKQIVRYVKDHHRLPDKLPEWVDKRGPIYEPEVAQGALSKRLAFAGKVGGGVFVGRLLIEGGLDVRRYLKGDLSKAAFQEALRGDFIKASGSGVLTATVLVCFTNPGTALVVVVATGACVVVDLVHNGASYHLGAKRRARAQFRRELPSEFRKGLVPELVRPDPSLRRFHRKRFARWVRRSGEPESASRSAGQSVSGRTDGRDRYFDNQVLEKGR
ncbi:MAG: hypothetical protein R6V58_01745 [Planctomycetota bacterium]